MSQSKLKLAVHKFTSCDGCQLTVLNLGSDLLSLADQVDIVHFAEAGPVDPEAKVDIALIEGSVSTPDEVKRIQTIRANTDYMITIGACATAGGIQALRNFADNKAWMSAVYAKPEIVKTLDQSLPISAYVKVDHELWGCPVSREQLLEVLQSVLKKAKPRISHDSVCLQCKRRGYPCVMVTKGEPCMGPVTRLGCGALCPSANRACYACFGPAENPNTRSLTQQFRQLGLSDEEIRRRFLSINNQAPAFLHQANLFKES